jgi:Protein of unknown function (DUF3768)
MARIFVRASPLAPQNRLTPKKPCPRPSNNLSRSWPPNSVLRLKRDAAHGAGLTLQELPMTTNTKAIRALNDELRQNFAAGTALMTAGVAAMGAETVARIVKTIAVYDDFCHANDPCEEHDFGSFDVDGHTILFKIDYFDKSRSYLSPDPSDPSVTERVITIMLAEEY